MLNLFHGDCLEILPKINVSAQMIFADLPYGNTASKWDKVIDLSKFWSLIKPIINSNSAIIFTATFKFAVNLYNSNSDWFRYDLVWDKKFAGNFINAPYQILRSHESILVFSPAASTYSKNDNMLYNPQMLEREKLIKTGKINNPEFMHSSGKQIPKIYDKQYPKSILRFPKKQGKQRHPNEKPVELLEYLIKTYTNSGDLVIDPVMGSGSTGEACLNLNRSFIGIEKEEKYYNNACERLKWPV